jgi:putative transport protein
MKSFFAFLQQNPYLLLFLVVGVSVWIGRLNIKATASHYGSSHRGRLCDFGQARRYTHKARAEQFRQKPVPLSHVAPGSGGSLLQNSLKGDGLKFTFWPWWRAYWAWRWS